MLWSLQSTVSKVYIGLFFFKTSSVWLCLIFFCLQSRAADNRHEDFYGTLSLLPLITQLGSVPLNTITHTYHPDIRQRCFAPQLIRFGNECKILTSSYTHNLTRFSPSTALEGWCIHTWVQSEQWECTDEHFRLVMERKRRWLQRSREKERCTFSDSTGGSDLKLTWKAGKLPYTVWSLQAYQAGIGGVAN